ncbi:hypothetical protein B1812_18635 [Methylocystis bryophila]|uniref:DUF423 domain-containing protein n=2 Tax=Methylocystis bryophila TaxID=655015 RepID=A0A1W6N1T4_9HYPH|nr:hypothetical protein B1812_18635 [Methylocystis bryophila]
MLFIAALHGGCGVTLAAAAAHLEASPLLASASQFLMIHAAAGAGLAAALLALRPGGPALAFLVYALQGGTTLFCADLALRAFAQHKLFPYAAPIGGSMTILAWAALAIWAALCLLRMRGADEGRDSL